MTKIVMGVRTRRMNTGKSRWSEGRVHLLTYDKDAKAWKLYCRSLSRGSFMPYYGADVPDDTPVTCKKCLKSGLIR